MALSEIGTKPTYFHLQQVLRTFKPIINFAHSQNVKMGIQLAHAGRKASTMLPWDDHLIATPEEGGWQTVSASPIPYNNMQTPKELTIDEINQLTKQFGIAAKRAESA